VENAARLPPLAHSAALITAAELKNRHSSSALSQKGDISTLGGGGHFYFGLTLEDLTP